MPSRPARPPATDSWGGAPLDIDRLRRLWKPRRDAYAKALLYESVRIRIHRALTWLAYAERCDGSKDLDARLVGQWIALNSLYGQWDRRTGSPMADRDSLRSFTRQILSHDHDGLLAIARDDDGLVVLADAIHRIGQLGAGSSVGNGIHWASPYMYR